MAYGFNEDRSKAEVYTQAEIDDMDLADNQALAQEAIARQAGDSALDTRISNIIADGQQTEGNTELIDIRTGYDGVVYTTAGDAVRTGGRGSLLTVNDISVGHNPISLELERGRLSDETGLPVGNNTTNGRTPRYLYIGDDYTFKFRSDIAMYFYFFDKNLNFIGHTAGLTRADISRNSMDGAVYFKFFTYSSNYTYDQHESHIELNVSSLNKFLLESIWDVSSSKYENMEFYSSDLLGEQVANSIDVDTKLIEIDGFSITKFENNQGNITYVWCSLLNVTDINVGDEFKFTIEEASGARLSKPVCIYVKKSDQTNVRLANGSSDATLRITQEDIDAGAVSVQFGLYASSNGFNDDEVATFSGIKIYLPGYEEQQEDIEYIDSNVLLNENKHVVTGSTNYVFKVIKSVTNVQVGDRYNFKVDKVEGASTIGSVIYIYCYDINGTRLESKSVSADRLLTYVVNNSDIYRIDFVLYPAAGTPLPTGSATFYNVLIYKNVTPFIYTSNGYLLLNENRLPISTTIKTVAHRGDDIMAPANTKAAYIKARKRGIEIAENDVMKSVEGSFYMWHDTSFSRLGSNILDTNGYVLYTENNQNYYWFDSENEVVYNTQHNVSSVDISELTVCQPSLYGIMEYGSIIRLPDAVIDSIDAGIYMGYPGEHVLTFHDWVLLCKQLGMEIYIDKKLQYSESDIETLFASILSLGMKDHTSWIVSALSEADKIRSLDPNARLLLLQNPSSQYISSWGSYNTGRGFVFNGDGKQTTYEEVQLGLSNGFEVECWYVDVGQNTNPMPRIRELVSFGVTGISLDHWRVDEAFDYLH